jgi:type II secretory pathway component PulK
MVLGVLALDFGQYMRDDAMAAVNFAEETQGYYIALAGMNRTLLAARRAYQHRSEGAVRGQPDDDDDEDPEEEEDPFHVPPDGQWHENTFGGGGYAVRVTDESGRLPLNVRASDLGTLRLILQQVIGYHMKGGKATAGMDVRENKEVSTVVDAILDWRDADSDAQPTGHRAERDDYRKWGLPYGPKNGFFDSPEELLRVHGVTAELYYGSEGLPGLRDLFSIFNRDVHVNPLAAPPAVLQVLLGLDPEGLEALLVERDELGIAVVPKIRGLLAQNNLPVTLIPEDLREPRIIAVEVRADTREARNQSRVGVVADVAAEVTDGIRVLRWFDRVPWTGTLEVQSDLPEGAS